MLQVDICMNHTAGGHQPLSSTYPPSILHDSRAWSDHEAIIGWRHESGNFPPAPPILSLCQSLLRCLRQHVWIIPILQTLSEWTFRGKWSRSRERNENILLWAEAEWDTAPCITKVNIVWQVSECQGGAGADPGPGHGHRRVLTLSSQSAASVILL